MNRSVTGIIGVVVSLVATSCGGVDEPDTLSGRWEVTAFAMTGGLLTCPNMSNFYQLTRHGDDVGGSEPTAWSTVCSGPQSQQSAVVTSFPADITAGKLEGSSIRFTATHETLGPTSQTGLLLLTSDYVGQIDSTKMTGTVNWTCRQMSDGSTVVLTGTFQAIRVP
jgi:hypothetical protein